MTQWLDPPEGGRERGPVGLLRAWLSVMVRPRRFFREGVVPGDQAPGLTFAIAVVAVAQSSRFAFGLDEPLVFLGFELVSVFLWVCIVALVLAPLALHLVSALQTVLLMPLASDRGGVSETVQVIGYATAPCVFAGVPIVGVQVAAACYGAVLMIVGLATVHGISYERATILGGLPALLVFGYGFRTADAFLTLLRQYYII